MIDDTMAGWVIACASGRTLIGRLIPAAKLNGQPIERQKLSPVYDLTSVVTPGEDGSPFLMRFAAPVFGIGSLDSIEIPAGSLIVDVGELDASSRRSFARVVRSAEQLAGILRAKESGLVVAGGAR